MKEQHISPGGLGRNADHAAAAAVHLYLPLRFLNPPGIASRLWCIGETMVLAEEAARHAFRNAGQLDGNAHVYFHGCPSSLTHVKWF